MSIILPLTTFIKDPEATVEYTFDWTDVLPDTDYITTSTFTVSGLDIISQSFTERATSAFISGGTDNTTYYVVNTIQSFEGRIDEKAFEISVSDEKEIYSLLLDLRLHLGDLDHTAYRYLDKWLIRALLLGIKTLGKWWDYKYLINFTTEDVYRNTTKTFTYTEPPVIEDQDIRPIILMAGIIVKSGQLENVSWTLGSWRDAEISYSNISAGAQKENSIKRDWEELKSLLTPPNRRLAGAVKTHLPGYFDIEK